MTSSIEEVKTIVNWRSPKDEELNQYCLRIYWVSWVRAVVVASDITVLPESKIADITPEIIRVVRDCFDLFPNQIMLVEHYPITNVPDGDVYLHLLLANKEFIRYEISNNELMRLIRKPIQQE